ncbi:uncharacterized protein ACLA_046060 [Aspergillus clavatus NRRL 1]|uniref:Uncharacterized protein n=1 Tax=Aspergillus clavatus (strain ATCC 1007 / CBS 513.65 / DSM 816 / NCTC 3887 / NRRL 1 / QM 1276 / 107) TaxID=344612 RepID=A1CGY6_ASPCL|nr:uncharacterized protein ACLA_046060 [Aspergillus clavatus NRRL 1]EAW10141.1 hypothetical protein ACLA_046060 [Aspergillus clavatus NRRL 1]
MTTSLIIACISLGVSTAYLLFPVKEWMQHWFPWLSPQHGQDEVRHPTITVEEVQSVLNDHASPIRALLENFVTDVQRNQPSEQTRPLAQPGTVHTTGSSGSAALEVHKDASNPLLSTGNVIDGLFTKQNHPYNSRMAPVALKDELVLDTSTTLKIIQRWTACI